MSLPLSLTLFDHSFSDLFPEMPPTDEATIEGIFHWLRQQTIFQWHYSHNFCEARAEAASLLLEAAGIPHAKCWVFGAAFLHKGFVGGLKNNWNYHVAIAIPIIQSGLQQWLVIDPSTESAPVLLEDWAAGVTAFSHSYHFLRTPNSYIFPGMHMGSLPWHKRHHRNFRWTMQGLIGINSLSAAGKARITFNKRAIDQSTRAFMQLRDKCRQEGLSIFAGQ